MVGSEAPQVWISLINPYSYDGPLHRNPARRPEFPDTKFFKMAVFSLYIVVYIYTYAYIYIDTYRHIHIHIRRHRHILHVLCIYIHGSYVYIQYILYVYIILVGGLERVLFFHFIYGLSSFPLTNSIICQRGRAQPPTKIYRLL